MRRGGTATTAIATIEPFSGSILDWTSAMLTYLLLLLQTDPALLAATIAHMRVCTRLAADRAMPSSLWREYDKVRAKGIFKRGALPETYLYNLDAIPER